MAPLGTQDFRREEFFLFVSAPERASTLASVRVDCRIRVARDRHLTGSYEAENRDERLVQIHLEIRV